MQHGEPKALLPCFLLWLTVLTIDRIAGLSHSGVIDRIAGGGGAITVVLDRISGPSQCCCCLEGGGLSQWCCCLELISVLDVDDCGLRYVLAVGHDTYLMKTLSPSHRLQFQKSGFSFSDVIWGFHSESEEVSPISI